MGSTVVTGWTEGREFCVLADGVSVMHTVDEQAAIDHMLELNAESPGSAVVQSRRVQYGPWEDW
jgi:hypothetical protein